MKITVSGRITRGSDGVYRFPLVLGVGKRARVVHYDLDANYKPDNPEPTRPINEKPEDLFPWEGYWAYRGIAVEVKGGNELSLEEVRLKIKHAILRRDKAFERMRREIEALENLEQVDIARRERLPDSVRLFVWQRDQGKCTKCGGGEKLEFDHIIPVIKGGSNTERNVQLLCEQIHSGDLLVVDRSLEAVDGNVIVAVLDGELVCKQLEKRRAVRLLPANRNYLPIEIQNGQDFSIWGVVTNVIHPL